MELSRIFRLLAAGGTTTLILLACVPVAVTEPTNEPPASAHADFPLLGRHLSTDCEACHIDGAVEQELDSNRENGWVDEIGTDCEGCHTDTREEVFPGLNHGNLSTCSSAGGCHSASHTCWREVRGPCVEVPTPEPGVTPPPFGHEGERGILFPLEGVHFGIGCGECHVGVDDADQQGGAQECEMCHSRADGPGAGHYPPDNLNDPDTARGCKACHAAEAADTKLIVPASWTAGSSEHNFYWPHNGADACLDCHLIPGSQTSTDYTCTNSGCHSALSPNAYHDDPNGPCADCHEEGN